MYPVNRHYASNQQIQPYQRIRPGIGLGGPGSGFGFFPGPGFGFGPPIGFGVPFLTGLAAGALLTPGPGFGYQPYPPYQPYPYY